MIIVVTGANGQLGQAVQAVLHTHQIVAWDLAQVDVTSLDAVRKGIESVRPQLVINTAAYTDVDGAESHPTEAYRVNALGPRNLALVTGDAGIPLLHVSTDYVFDGTATRPYHEFDRPNPISVYGASKLAGEEAIRALNPRHFIVRTAWLYHVHGQNFPNTIVNLANRQPLRIVSDQYGSPTYAPHLAEAIAKLIDTTAYGTFHLAGSGGGTSWFEFATSLFHALEMTVTIQPVSTCDFPRPAPRPRYAVLTSIQDPHIELPPWKEGVQAFARAVRARQ
ncbi:MAG: dTDP-4-dehydrorhamnose reductase [Nitrospirae bacterium]|nr:MAG: dTDP-4-dehydrorhamnose reductase [Nitrospirota bacterium]